MCHCQLVMTVASVTADVTLTCASKQCSFRTCCVQANKYRLFYLILSRNKQLNFENVIILSCYYYFFFLSVILTKKGAHRCLVQFFNCRRCVLRLVWWHFCFDNMKSSTVLMTGPWSLLYYNSVSLKIMSLGKKIVFTPTARPVKMMLQVIRDCKVDVIFGTSDYFYEMANNSCPTDDYFENLKIIYCGGTRLNAEMAEKLQKSFPKVQIRHSFGSTECGVITRYSVGDISKPGSIGRVCPGRTVKVVDLHTRALLGPNQVGEMCVKSPTLMQGYLDLELADYIDEDNFFMTGDLAYYDKNNYLFFVERTSNFIWWQDHKVSPGELENVLLQHPAVCDVVVIGRPAPVVKEVPVAIVVKKPGTDVSEDQLIEFVASQVSPPMQLRGGVYFISEIPKTAGGKPMRLQLKEMLNKNLST